MHPALQPAPFAPGTVWLVGAGPGDPGLLTLHALQALQQADVILHDALVAPEILALAGTEARLLPVGKRAGQPSSPQLAINQRLIELARQGDRVLRLKCGDPCVFGRGGEEALALAAAAVPFRLVPGVTSGIGGLAYAGIPATHRGIGQAVTLVTGHGAAGREPEAVDWAALAQSGATLVLYMGLRRIGKIAETLLAAGRPADEPVAFVSDASTPRQTIVLTSLAAAAEVGALRPSSAATLIVIGSLVNLQPAIAAWQQTEPMRLRAPTAEAAARAN